MKKLGWMILMALACLPLYVGATTISFTTSNLSGNVWQYEYDVINDSLSSTIDEFTIYFDRDLFSNLNVEASPAGWDSIAVQPDSGIPADGFFDGLAFGQGLAPGAAAAGFAVSFEFLGAGSPGPQPFDVVDPVSFDILDSGMTVAETATDLPEPDSLALLGLALSALAAAQKRVGRGHRA